MMADPNGYYYLDLDEPSIAKLGSLHVASEHRDTYFHPATAIDFATETYFSAPHW